MITPADLDFFGKQAAREYTENSVPLNQTITKLAQEHGLNKTQTDRVVETANTETYISIANSTAGPDRYVKFDVASPIEPHKESVKTASTTTDYEVSPEAFKPMVKTAVASATHNQEDRLKTLYGALAVEMDKRGAAQDFLTKRAEELQLLWNGEVIDLESHVKQAALSGTPLAYIEAVMKTASPRPTTKIIVQKFREDFEKDACYRRHIDFDTNEPKRAIINEKHPIVNSLCKLATYEQQLARIGAAQINNSKILKEASQVMRAGGQLGKEMFKFFGEAGKKSLEFAAAHPAGMVMTGGVGVAGVVGAQAGRAKGAKNVSALQMRYLPNSHSRTMVR